MIVTARKMVALLTPAQRKSALVLLALMVVGMIMETFGLGLILPAIALLMESDLGARYRWLAPVLAALGNPTKSELVVGGLAVLVTIYLLKALFLAFLAARQMRFVFDVQAELSQRLFDIYLHQPFTFHLHRNSALMIRNAGNEVVLFTFNCMLPSLTLLTEGLVVAGIATLLLAVEPVGAILVLMVLGVCAWAFQRATSRRIARWGEERQHHEGLRTQHLQQGLGGAKEVILLGREEHFLDQYRIHNQQTARMGQYQQSLQALPRLWLELLAVTALAILVLAMLAQGHAMDAIIQTVGLFAAAAFRLAPAANRMLNSLQSLLYGIAVINTLHDEFCLPTQERRRTSGNPIAFRREIALSNVTYTYPGTDTAAIKDVSLVIRKGECVGFVGHSGSGKTTLVDVVLGLLEPTAGRVLVDERDIYEDLRSWQNQIGYVPQSIYLVDSSLRANIAFGLPDSLIDGAAVARAVRAAQLDEFIASLPDGLETVVGERGVRISGGQRQRIGIARALYHDPAVVVLDEATSSLDTATEHDVMQAVSVLRGNKTVIIVAHRLSTVEGCDRLYRLREGEVFEERNPRDELSPGVPVPPGRGTKGTGTEPDADLRLPVPATSPRCRRTDRCEERPTTAHLWIKKRLQVVSPPGVYNTLAHMWGYYLAYKHRQVKRRFGSRHGDRTFYVIRRLPPGGGLFSNVWHVISHLHKIRSEGWIPVVDMERYATFYNEPVEIHRTFNAWEYYFRQPSGYDLNEVYESSNVVVSDMRPVDPDLALCSDFTGDLNPLSQFIRESIALAPPIEAYFSRVHHKLFNGARVLGVFSRGSDYAALRPAGHPRQPEMVDLLERTAEFVHRWNPDKIFVTTEEQRVVDAFVEAFPGKVITTDRYFLKSYDGKTLVPQIDTQRRHGKYLSGLEYLVDIYMLSRCQYFIGALTCGSKFALALNGGQYEQRHIIDLGNYD